MLFACVETHHSDLFFVSLKKKRSWTGEFILTSAVTYPVDIPCVTLCSLSLKSFEGVFQPFFAAEETSLHASVSSFVVAADILALAT